MPAMAATTARLHYAGETRLVAVNLSTWKGLVAHPERDRARSRTGRATERWVDVHNNHGGATDVDGGAPTTVVDEMSK